MSDKTNYTDNFLEIENKDDADLVDEKVYSFIIFSEKRFYMFKKRAGHIIPSNYTNFTTPFLELETKEQANTVNLDVYSFQRFSFTKNRYIFKRRRGY